MTDTRTQSAWPEEVKQSPNGLTRAERMEFYRTQMPAAQYRDYLVGLNDGLNPRDGQQGRLM